jgi:hypothetical protein
MSRHRETSYDRERRLSSLDDAVGLLAVSTRTVTRFAERGELRIVRSGRLVRWHPRDAGRWRAWSPAGYPRLFDRRQPDRQDRPKGFLDDEDASIPPHERTR